MSANHHLLVRLATSSVYRAEDRLDPQFYIFATLASGVLKFEVVARLPSGQRGAISGRTFFAEMMAHFGPTVRIICADWSQASGLTTNLDQFNRAAVGLSLPDAAALTWTGLRASEYGYDQVLIISAQRRRLSGPYTRVRVEFTR